MKRTGIVEPAMGHVLDAWYDQTMMDRLLKQHAIGKQCPECVRNRGFV